MGLRWCVLASVSMTLSGKGTEKIKDSCSEILKRKDLTHRISLSVVQSYHWALGVKEHYVASV